MAGGSTVPPSEVTTQYEPKSVETWSEAILTKKGGTGILTRTVFRAGNDYLLLEEYDFHPDRGNDHRESWEVIRAVSSEEAADLLQQRIVEERELEGTPCRLRMRASGQYEVVTPKGYFCGKSLEAEVATFPLEPRVVREWSGEGNQYWVISDGTKTVVYILHRRRDYEDHSLLEMDPRQIKHKFGIVV